MDHSLSPGIRGRISANRHSLSGAKTIPALGIKGAILWQFEFEWGVWLRPPTMSGRAGGDHDRDGHATWWLGIKST